MKNIFCCLLLVCLSLGNSACKKDNSPRNVQPAKPITLTTKQAEKLSGDNAFAFNLFREIATSGNKENAFISPLSVTMALGMLFNGTSPDARAEMATALGISDFSDTEVNEYYQTLYRALLNIDPLTAISIANSIWCKQGYPVKPTFIEINRNYFDAAVQTLDFSLPSTLKAINMWCAQKTNDKITSILDVISEDAVMYLINAVYFKSKWQFEFDKKDTKKEKFTLENGAQVNLDMMNQTATLPYYANEMLQCIEMPYGNQAFSMVAILPNEGITLDDLVNHLDHNAWENILSNLWERNVQIKFPRFKQECKFQLREPIYNLGMHLIFLEGGNLNGIAEDPELCVSRIIHKTFVEVNEEGTEAAAVTAIEVVATSVGPPSGPISFFANRPFLYLIKEKSTGAILFIGRMDQPMG